MMRDAIVRFRARADEVSKIREAAKARGLSVSEMLRRAALGVRMPSRRLDAREIKLLTRLVGELGRIGGNLNQMVRRANAGKLVGHDAELDSALSELNATREKLWEVLK